MSTTIEDLFDSIEEVASEAVEAQQLLYTVEDELLKLKRENKKLRELVKDMWQAISRNDGCGWDIDANCCTSDECNVSCKYWHRMKELGIEV
jgi:hypothetical protein